MFTRQQQDRVRQMVERITDIRLPGSIVVSQGKGLTVKYAPEACSVQAEDMNALSRGFFLVARAIKEGRRTASISQNRAIASCGVMLDVSRGAVLTVEAVKRYIDYLAVLGLNLLMLYTEDTYEVPEYPYFGYLRGRYQKADLMEIDAYAAGLGIEVVPCIQTLAHLAQFLQWEDSDSLSDQPDVLLVDDEAVYQFINAEIQSVRECFATNRIHIGMDEAHGIGLGRYMQKHGIPRDRHVLLSRHLNRVVDICCQYDFHPMMWSDMFFRLSSNTNDYYDENIVIPQSVIDAIPDVDMCYWDYYHMDQQFYSHMLQQHARMCSNTAFAGGIWTWSGFLPHIKRTMATMIPALKACMSQRIDTVFATMWGDDGAETDFFLGAGLLPMFSETSWQGAGCSHDEMMKTTECLINLDWDAYNALGEFFPDESETASGKALLWSDPLFPLMEGDYEPIDDIVARMRKALKRLQPYNNRCEIRYAANLMQTVIAKGELVGKLRGRYLMGDRDWLKQVSDIHIPALIRDYEQGMGSHRALWERDMKRFGWEILSLRYGGAIGRLKDTAYEINRYLNGQISVIAELEEKPLPALRIYGHQYKKMITPYFL